MLHNYEALLVCMEKLKYQNFWLYSILNGVVGFNHFTTLDYIFWSEAGRARSSPEVYHISAPPIDGANPRPPPSVFI